MTSGRVQRKNKENMVYNQRIDIPCHETVTAKEGRLLSKSLKKLSEEGWTSSVHQKCG